MRLFTARIIRKSDFSKQKNPVMSSSREVHFISRVEDALGLALEGAGAVGRVRESTPAPAFPQV